MFTHTQHSVNFYKQFLFRKIINVMSVNHFIKDQT